MSQQTDQEYWVRFMCALASNSNENVVRGRESITETADWMLGEMKKRFDRPSGSFPPPPQPPEDRPRGGGTGNPRDKHWWKQS